MQLSKKEYEVLMELRNITFTHKDNFTSSEIEVLNRADSVLADVFEKHKAVNKKTADYIAKKRLVDKNYAR